MIKEEVINYNDIILDSKLLVKMFNNDDKYITLGHLMTLMCFFECYWCNVFEEKYLYFNENFEAGIQVIESESIKNCFQYNRFYHTNYDLDGNLIIKEKLPRVSYKKYQTLLEFYNFFKDVSLFKLMDILHECKCFVLTRQNFYDKRKSQRLSMEEMIKWFKEKFMEEVNNEI